MNKKFLAIILAAAVLVGGVALGVHLLHKDALAATPFIIFVQDQLGNGVPGFGIEVWLYNGGGVLQGDVLANALGGGWYWAPIHHFNFPNATWWGAWAFDEPDTFDEYIDPPGPETGLVQEIDWQGENQFTWEVEVELPPPR